MVRVRIISVALCDVFFCSSRHPARHRRLTRFMVTSELYMFFEIVSFSLGKAAGSKTLFQTDGFSDIVVAGGAVA